MGLIFKKEHILLILEGVKTQTRRRHRRPLKIGRVYDVKKDWYHSTGIKIRIINAYRQRLEDITPDEAFKEGGYSIKDFISVWKRINSSWDPDEEVLVYEFKLINKPRDGSVTV